MLIRSAIEEAYFVRKGVVMAPGKFQGEPVYTPYFYDQWQNWGADCASMDMAFFHIEDFERQLFPELGNAVGVELVVRGQVVQSSLIESP